MFIFILSFYCKLVFMIDSLITIFREFLYTLLPSPVDAYGLGLVDFARFSVLNRKVGLVVNNHFKPPCKKKVRVSGQLKS